MIANSNKTVFPLPVGAGNESELENVGDRYITANDLWETLSKVKGSRLFFPLPY